MAASSADADTGTDGNQPAFGAFANGGDPFAAGADLVAITGTATYEGSAAGVKATASAVDYFTADATLTAKFGAPGTDADPDAVDDEAGTITGKIHNIMAGGERVAHAIYLDESAIGAAGALSGRARKGDRIFGDDGNVTYPFNGRWSGAFYNPAMNDPATAADESLTTAPGSVAGTFGVTMPDDADTEDVNEMTSFVGAFGAHKDD